MRIWGRLTSATDWTEVLSEGRERLAKLESFQEKLFRDLGEHYKPAPWIKPRGVRLRIEGFDTPEMHVDGLLDTVRREIYRLRWCLPLWERNAELYKLELERARRQRREIDAMMIHSLVVPQEIQRWARESSALTDEAERVY